MVIAPFPWDANESYELDGQTYTVHPIARLFPLIQGEEFKRLVEDVREHGLRRPILVTDGKVIVDGRNRARAAIEAGVLPQIEKLAADANPVKVSLSENIHRRQMSKGQVAMLGALLRVRSPFGDPAAADSLAAAAEGGGDGVGIRDNSAMGRRPTQDEVAAQLPVSVPYLRRAERVLESLPDLAVQVLSGSLELNAAYQTWRKQARPVDDVRQGPATATNKAIVDRTGQRPKFLEPSGSRATTAMESTSRGEDPQAGEALSTDGEGASRPMLASSGNASPTLAVAETVTRSEAPGRSTELTTPDLLLACLRRTLGDIHLDACSSEAAQGRIAASEWYSAEQDGLSRPWHGTVHVFPPPERVGEFAGKLLTELGSGRVHRASFLGPADLRSGWAVQLLDAPACNGLVIERGRRSGEAAGDRQQEVGHLALFLLGVDPSGLSEVFDCWGVTLSTARRDTNHGNEATAARTFTEDNRPQSDSPTTSNANSSAPPTPKGDDAVVGPTADVDAISTSHQTGNRVPQTDQRQAPNAKPEASHPEIGVGISAVIGVDPDKIWNAGAWRERAKESRLGKGVQKWLDGVSKTTGRATQRSEPSRKADGASNGRTGSPSEDEN